MCPPADSMCVYVIGNVDVHEKFSILKGGKYINFIKTINVFSLVVSSPMVRCNVSVKLSRAVAS